MADTYVNKVILSSGEVLLDLTADTASAADVVYGKVFHLPTGEQTTGTKEETELPDSAAGVYF